MTEALPFLSPQEADRTQILFLTHTNEIFITDRMLQSDTADASRTRPGATEARRTFLILFAGSPACFRLFLRDSGSAVMMAGGEKQILLHASRPPTNKRLNSDFLNSMQMMYYSVTRRRIQTNTGCVIAASVNQNWGKNPKQQRVV